MCSKIATIQLAIVSRAQSTQQKNHSSTLLLIRTRFSFSFLFRCRRALSPRICQRSLALSHTVSDFPSLSLSFSLFLSLFLSLSSPSYSLFSSLSFLSLISMCSCPVSVPLLQHARKLGGKQNRQGAKKEKGREKGEGPKYRRELKGGEEVSKTGKIEPPGREKGDQLLNTVMRGRSEDTYV